MNALLQIFLSDRQDASRWYNNPDCIKRNRMKDFTALITIGGILLIITLVTYFYFFFTG